MNRRDAFLRWARETFGVNSWYTLTPAMEKEIHRNWADWEDTLIAWGILDGTEGGKEAYHKLQSLSWETVIHIGEALYQEEQNLFA